MPVLFFLFPEQLLKTILFWFVEIGVEWVIMFHKRSGF